MSSKTRGGVAAIFAAGVGAGALRGDTSPPGADETTRVGEIEGIVVVVC